MADLWEWGKSTWGWQHACLISGGGKSCHWLGGPYLIAGFVGCVWDSMIYCRDGKSRSGWWREYM